MLKTGIYTYLRLYLLVALVKIVSKGYSPFAMLYGREATTLSLLGVPLISSDKAMPSDAHIKDLVKRIIDIQATAYTSAYKTKMLELSPENAGRSPLPEFSIGDHVLYYQHRIWGRAHKLDTLWVRPLEVTFKQGSEYTVKLLSSGRLFSCVHAKFLRKYYPPKANLEGGNVVNTAIHTVSISPLLGYFECEFLAFEFVPRNESVSWSCATHLPHSCLWHLILLSQQCLVASDPTVPVVSFGIANHYIFPIFILNKI